MPREENLLRWASTASGCAVEAGSRTWQARSNPRPLQTGALPFGDSLTTASLLVPMKATSHSSISPGRASMCRRIGSVWVSGDAGWLRQLSRNLRTAERGAPAWRRPVVVPIGSGATGRAASSCERPTIAARFASASGEGSACTTEVSSIRETRSTSTVTASEVPSLLRAVTSSEAGWDRTRRPNFSGLILARSMRRSSPLSSSLALAMKVYQSREVSVIQIRQRSS